MLLVCILIFFPWDASDEKTSSFLIVLGSRKNLKKLRVGEESASGTKKDWRREQHVIGVPNA